MKNPAPQSARGSDQSPGSPSSSLAVFLRGASCLNRHDQSMSKMSSDMYNILARSGPIATSGLDGPSLSPSESGGAAGIVEQFTR
jgi:hypothetical protein